MNAGAKMNVIKALKNLTRSRRLLSPHSKILYFISLFFFLPTKNTETKYIDATVQAHKENNGEKKLITQTHKSDVKYVRF